MFVSSWLLPLVAILGVGVVVVEGRRQCAYEGGTATWTTKLWYTSAEEPCTIYYYDASNVEALQEGRRLEEGDDAQAADEGDEEEAYDDDDGPAYEEGKYGYGDDYDNGIISCSYLSGEDDGEAAQDDAQENGDDNAQRQLLRVASQQKVVVRLLDEDAGDDADGDEAAVLLGSVEEYFLFWPDPCVAYVDERCYDVGALQYSLDNGAVYSKTGKGQYVVMDASDIAEGTTHIRVDCTADRDGQVRAAARAKRTLIICLVVLIFCCGCCIYCCVRVCNPPPPPQPQATIPGTATAVHTSYPSHPGGGGVALSDSNIQPSATPYSLQA